MMEKRNGKSWFVWNLANIVSISRIVLAWLVLMPALSFNAVAILAVYLVVSDLVDGSIASWAKNTTGIGRILDTVGDKETEFIAATFLYVHNLINPTVYLLGMGVETAILILAMLAGFRVFKRSVKEHLGAWQSMKIVLDEADKFLPVGIYGKVRTGMYTTGLLCSLTRHIAGIEGFGVAAHIFFLGGITLAVYLVFDYIRKFEIWYAS